VEVELSEADTRSLLQEAPFAYRTHINDILLTALARTLTRWTGSKTVIVELEAHGREGDLGGMDLSRTVGWFTCVYPVKLGVVDAETDGEAIKRIKEQIRRVPDRGLGYGLLRYLRSEPEIVEEPWTTAAVEVSFNYLGQFDNVIGESEIWGAAEKIRVATRSENGRGSHLLAINAAIAEGRLRLSWSYSEALHRTETIERIAREYLEHLRALIVHCRLADGGYTPSDFPLAHLNQLEVDRLVDGVRVQDIYGLSSMQQGILFHTLYEPGSGAYVVQLCCRLSGQFDAGAFGRAWEGAIERNEVLRTSFHWEGLSEPVQIVQEKAEVEVEQYDWGDLGAEEQAELLSDYLHADRAIGFSLDKAPLTRVAVMRTGDRRYELVWTSHHLLMDGWSVPVLFREVMKLYEMACSGIATDLNRVHPYRRYLEWLQKQDLSQAERYWRERLKGFEAPTA
ncbi:MAG: condensation domain-containing protein, partial [Blastocatellia bacterium]